MRIAINLLLLLTSVHSLAQEDKGSYTVLKHVNIIDVNGSPIQTDMAVTINGNRISSIEKTSKARYPQNALIIDAKNKFLIPGLWDMHVHVFNNVSKRPPDTNDFSMYIANGVTGIREMWTKMESMPEVNRWRKQAYEFPGTVPRIGAVGTMVDGVPSQIPNSDTATIETSARKIVQQIKAAGIDFVKVYNRLPRKAYFAIADECKKQNIDFAGHVPSKILLKEAADAGQRSIEHLTGSRTVFEDDCETFAADTKKELPDSIAANSPAVPIMEQVLELCDKEKSFAIFKHMSEKNVWHCPTMVIYKRFATDSLMMVNDPRLKYISPSEKESWIKETGPRLQRKASRNYLNRVLTQVLEMKKAGIQFLAGTDFDNHYLYPGFSLHDELGLFVDAGFSPLEALQTATINPAKFLGAMDSLGTIEKGKIADMVLLDANPLTDIRNTQQINAVFVNGKYLSKEMLRAMLDNAAAFVNKK